MFKFCILCKNQKCSFGLNSLKQIDKITKHKLQYNKSLLNFKTNYKN